jgi:AcrR family transcriptional regulator
MTTARQPKVRGRPRNLAIDEALNAATLQLLAEVGYDGLTVDAVARIAGCGRASVYRRFANKAAFVHSVIYAAARNAEPQPAEMETPRDTLIAHVTAMLTLLDQSDGAVTIALAQARIRDPELGPALDDYYDREVQFYARPLEASVADLGVRFDTNLVIDSLIGAVIFRKAWLRRAVTPVQVEALVDQALRFARHLAEQSAASGSPDA